MVQGRNHIIEQTVRWHSNLFIAGADCPQDHPYTYNHGYHCCSNYLGILNEAGVSYYFLDNNHTAEHCGDAIECPGLPDNRCNYTKLVHTQGNDKAWGVWTTVYWQLCFLICPGGPMCPNSHIKTMTHGYKCCPKVFRRTNPLRRIDWKDDHTEECLPENTIDCPALPVELCHGPLTCM